MGNLQILSMQTNRELSWPLLSFAAKYHHIKNDCKQSHIKEKGVLYSETIKTFTQKVKFKEISLLVSFHLSLSLSVFRKIFVSRWAEHLSGFWTCRCFYFMYRKVRSPALWSPFKFIVVFPGELLFLFFNTAHCEWICSFAVFGEGLYFMSGEIKALPCLSDKENILAFKDEAT